MIMKRNLLPVVILVSAVLLMAVITVIMGIAQKPTVTEGNFEFSITYEIDGQSVTINDVFYARYDKNDGYTDSKTRIYVGKIGSMPEGERTYTIYRDDERSLLLDTRLFADYLMGDAEYDYFDTEAAGPQLVYSDSYTYDCTDEHIILEECGARIISWQYPTPIENSLVFSHISIADSDVVIPTILIGIIALVLTIVLVKRDYYIIPRPIDKVCVVFNFVIGFTAVPFVAVVASLFDALGSNDSLVNQTMYYIPALTLICIAASVSLRRRGHSEYAMAVQFAAPALFVLLLLFYGI